MATSETCGKTNDKTKAKAAAKSSAESSLPSQRRIFRSIVCSNLLSLGSYVVWWRLGVGITVFTISRTSTSSLTIDTFRGRRVVISTSVVRGWFGVVPCSIGSLRVSSSALAIIASVSLTKSVSVSVGLSIRVGISLTIGACGSLAIGVGIALTIGASVSLIISTSTRRVYISLAV
jgi:hypothetical protein